MGTPRRGPERPDRGVGEPALIRCAHRTKTRRGEAASLLAQDSWSPVEREAPRGPPSTMTPASPGIRPDSQSCWRIIKYLRGKMTREDMQCILFHPEAWEELVERSGLDRDEANMLYYILMEELTRHKEASMSGNLSEEEKMFLFCFPLQKYKLEKSIKELHAIADQVDTTHKMLTKTSLVASSSGTVSGVLSILGLALVPVTVGGSLMLSAAGLGLGAAAALTNMLTSILENRSNMAARERASRLVPIETTMEYNAFEEIGLSEISVLCVNRCIQLIKKVKELRAYQMAKANSGFMAKVNAAISRLPFWRAGGLQRASEVSVLSMSKGARVLGAAGAGLSLLQDVQSLLQSWKHLEEGARAETAEELRTLAKELDQELRQLTQRYMLTVQGQGCRRSPFLNQEPSRAGRTRDTEGLGMDSEPRASPGMAGRPGEPSGRFQLCHRKVGQPPVRLAKMGANQEEFLQWRRRDQELRKVISERTHPEISPYASPLHCHF